MGSKTFDKPPANLQSRIDQCLRDYHSRLLEPQLPVSVVLETLVVYGPRNKDGVQTAPAIRVRGSEAAACIRVTTLEERVAGRGDAVMWIDGDRYKHWHPETTNAVIDHQLTHLEIVLDRDDEPEFDDLGRVRLKLRPHDFEVGWFDEVAERHGTASYEVNQASRLIAKECAQLYFPGFEIRQSRKKRA